MKRRLLTGTYIVLGLALAFLSKMLTPYIFDCVVCLFASIGVWEVSKVFNKSGQYNNIYVAITFPTAILIGFIIAFLNSWAWMYYLLYVICVLAFYFILTFVLSVVLKEQTSAEMQENEVLCNNVVYGLKKAINTVVMLVYPTMMFCSLYILNHFYDLSISAKVMGANFDYYLLVSVFVITMLTDSLAMVVGKFLKGPKLCPKISPKKTISGAIGGLIGGVLGSFVVYLLFAINSSFVLAFNSVASLLTVVLLGVIGSVICQLGDIFASYLKRRAVVKDYGSLFPGHGGVMDRYDGLIFNAAFVLIYVLILF